METFQEDFNEAMNQLKSHLKNLNARFASQQWLLSELTVADLYLAGTLSLAF